MFCSAALAVSLWTQIEESRFLKYFLFTGVTAAVFGAGLYTEHRWKVPVTSRSLLVVATLLVPLNFLALAAFSNAPTLSDVWMLAGEAVAALVFSALTFLAGRAFCRPWAWSWAVGVMGPSLAMLAVRRWAEVANAWALWTLALIPLAVYFASSLQILRVASRWRHLGKLKTEIVLVSVGVIAFALGLTLALLAHRSAVHSAGGWPAVSWAIALGAGPLVACGLMLRERLGDRRARRGWVLTLLVTSVAVLAMGLQALGIVLAWPHTMYAAASAIIGAASLTVLARAYRLVPALWPTGPGWALGYLTGVQCAIGSLSLGSVPAREYAAALLSGSSGIALIPLVGVFGAIAAGLLWRRHAAASVYGAFAGACALLGLAIVMAHGYRVEGDPLGVTWVLAFYGVVSFVAAYRLRAVAFWPNVLQIAGTILAIGALYQTVGYWLPSAWRPERPFEFALLLGASVLLLADEFVAGRSSGQSSAGSSMPPTTAPKESALLTASAAATSIAAAILLFHGFERLDLGWYESIYLGWAAILWLEQGIFLRRPRLIYLAVSVGTLTAMTGTVSFLAQSSWVSAGLRFYEPWALQAAAMAGLLPSLGVALARWSTRQGRSNETRAFWDLRRGVLDHLITGAFVMVFGVVAFLGIFGLFDGMGAASAATAFGAGAWGVWLLLLVVLGVQSLSHRTRGRAMAIFMTLWFVCFLIGGQFPTRRVEATVWALSGFFLAVTIVVALRFQILRALPPRWHAIAVLEGPRAARLARNLYVTLTFVPVALYGLVLLAAATPLQTVPIFVVIIALIAQAILVARPSGVVLAGLLLHLGATVLWLAWRPASSGGAPAAYFDGFGLQSAVWAVTGIVFVLGSLSIQRPETRRRFAAPSIFYAAVTLLTAWWLVGVLFGTAYTDIFTRDGRLPALGILWVAVLATLALVSLRSLSFHRSRDGAGVYLAGLAVFLVAAAQAGLSGWRLQLALVAAGSLYPALWDTGWNHLPGFRRLLCGDERGVDTSAIAERLRLERSVARVTFVLWLIVIAMAFYLFGVLTPERIEASWGTVLALRLGVALLTGVLVYPMRGVFRRYMRSEAHAVPFLFAATTGVLLAWAPLRPGTDILAIVNHLAAAMVALAVFGWGCRYVGTKARGGLRLAARESAVLCSLLFSGGLLALVILEMRHGIVFGSDGLLPAVGVGVLVAGGVGVLLAGRTALLSSARATDTVRIAHVYLAECLAALLCAQVRVTMPWFFQGFFQKIWPYAVVLVAALLGALSEWARRRGRAPIDLPLFRTAVALPIVAIAGWWFLPSEANYALVLFASAAVYGGLSVLRGSFVLSTAAVLAANGGLWYLFAQRDGLGFAEHPQLWLIPLALSVLVATFIQRRRMEPAQLAVARYTALVCIYLSSAADIVIQGLASSAWLPLLLATWSTLGVLVGLALRLRSFLVTGSCFLLVSLVALIAHAATARGWTWLWYVAGMALGIVIMVLFALFEKKRTQIRELLRRFQGWSG